jgi:hypothetical protein
MASYRRPPKGWACKKEAGHEGSCPAYPTNIPLKFLRRNEKGKLERLVSNGEWTGLDFGGSGQHGYWWVWESIARARGI